MAIRTAFTELFQIDHPLVLAPMGGASGGALAAAVSEAGGLGLVGGGYAEPGWLERELGTVASTTDKPWGAGVITWAASEDAIRLILSCRPAAVFLSFGDPAPFGALVKESGTRLICQVQDVAGARRAAAAGADVIVAQGTEAGGHGSRRAAGDPDIAMVWAGEGTDLITAVEPAGNLVTQIMAQAEDLLRGAPRQLDH